MVTTKRSSEVVNTYDNTASGGVGLLERPRAQVNNTAPVVPEKQQETYDQAKERMQKNLDRLLNYDRYAEQEVDAVQETEQVESAVAFSDEDIRPTSTTMQFGDDIDQIRQEMQKATASDVEGTYRLNGKGKLAVILYSLAVTIILALIVLNTGVLANLGNTAAAKSAQLAQTMERFNAVQERIESISDSNYIIDIAENQYGMIKQ